MSLKLTRKIGKTTYTLDVEPSTLIKSLNSATWLKDAPEKCSECGGVHLDLTGRVTVAKQGPNTGKEYSYLELRCLDCFAKATAGAFRDGKGFFWKDYGKMTKWEGKGTQSSQGSQNNPEPADDDSEVPF